MNPDLQAALAEQARDRQTMTAAEFKAKWPLADAGLERLVGFGTGAEVADATWSIGVLTNEQMERGETVEVLDDSGLAHLFDGQSAGFPLCGANFRRNEGAPKRATCSHCRDAARRTRQEPEWGTDCDVCGWCDTPGACVAAHVCPTCDAGSAQPCREGQRFVKYHDARWSLVVNQRPKEVEMAGQPDPKDSGATAVAEKPKAEATEKPKAEKKGLDKGYIKSVVSRVEKGLKYSEIEAEFVKATKAVPDGFKSHYPAIRKAAIDHFGSPQKANAAKAAGIEAAKKDA